MGKAWKLMGDAALLQCFGASLNPKARPASALQGKVNTLESTLKVKDGEIERLRGLLDARKPQVHSIFISPLTLYMRYAVSEVFKRIILFSAVLEQVCCPL